jgi:hypothetical protein
LNVSLKKNPKNEAEIDILTIENGNPEVSEECDKKERKRSKIRGKDSKDSDDIFSYLASHGVKS